MLHTCAVLHLDISTDEKYWLIDIAIILILFLDHENLYLQPTYLAFV